MSHKYKYGRIWGNPDGSIGRTNPDLVYHKSLYDKIGPQYIITTRLDDTYVIEIRDHFKGIARLHPPEQAAAVHWVSQLLQSRNIPYASIEFSNTEYSNTTVTYVKYKDHNLKQNNNGQLIDYTRIINTLDRDWET